MKITSAQVYVCAPDRNFVTVELGTDEGVLGLGDATLNGRERAVVTYLEEYLLPCVQGRDPFDTEDIWQYLYHSAYWRGGPVAMAAIGAIDVALWDIKSKALNVPLYQLLGGKSRTKMLAYGHAHGRNIPETLEQIHRQQERGFKAIRVQSGFPGYEEVYGIGRKGDYEPAIRGHLPAEERWDSAAYLRFVPRLFEKVRETFGEQLHLLHDTHHRLRPVEAVQLVQSLAPYSLFWLEDVIPTERPEGFRHVRGASGIPLAAGEVCATVEDCRMLISERWIDFLRMSISHGGGLTPMLKIAALAGFYDVRMGCHGASDMSPVCLAATLHFDQAVHNFGIQEYMGHSPLTEEVFPHGYAFDQGYLQLSDAPGLGVAFNRDLAKKYPYKKAYLPVNRLADGTIHHW